MLNNFTDDKYQKFKEDIYNISFIIDDTVLCDDIHAIILSLINDFVTIAQQKILHTIEIAQHYVYPKKQENGIQNCEIVLCFDIISNNYSDGSLRFYAKYQKDNGFFYVPIQLVRINAVKTCQHLNIEQIEYQNIDKMQEIEEQKYVAMSRAQTDAIKANTLAKKLSIMNPDDISKVVDVVNEITTKVRDTLTDDSSFKLSVPPESTIHIAKVVAKSCAEISKKNNMVFILVPNSDFVINLAIGKMKYSVLLDANLAIIPLSCLSADVNATQVISNLYILHKATDKGIINTFVESHTNTEPQRSISINSFWNRIYKKIRDLWDNISNVDNSNKDSNSIKILSNYISKEMNTVYDDSSSDSDIALFTTEKEEKKQKGGKHKSKHWRTDDISSDDINLFTSEAPRKRHAPSLKDNDKKMPTVDIPNSLADEDSGDDINLFTDESEEVMFEPQMGGAQGKQRGGNDDDESSSTTESEDVDDVDLFTSD